MEKFIKMVWMVNITKGLRSKVLMSLCSYFGACDISSCGSGCHKATFSWFWPHFPAHCGWVCPGDWVLADGEREEVVGTISGHRLWKKSALGHGRHRWLNFLGRRHCSVPFPTHQGYFCWILRIARNQLLVCWNQSTFLLPQINLI